MGKLKFKNVFIFICLLILNKYDLYQPEFNNNNKDTNDNIYYDRIIENEPNVLPEEFVTFKQTDSDKDLLFEKTLLQDKIAFDFLTHMKGSPRTMTSDKLKELRYLMPHVVRDWINLINNEQLLKDLYSKKIPFTLFDEYKNSITFLDIVQCEVDTFSVCFRFNSNFKLPESKLVNAFLSVTLKPWIRIENLALKVYFQPIKKQELLSSTLIRKPKIHKASQLFIEIHWDLSKLLQNLQLYNLNRPYSFTIEFVQNNNHINSNLSHSFDVESMEKEEERLKEIIKHQLLFKSSNEKKEVKSDADNMDTYFDENVFDNNLISNQNCNISQSLQKSKFIVENSHIVMQLKTWNTINLEMQYKPKRIKNRSYLTESHAKHQSSCPSFLNNKIQETKCCLFRYTLNKLQIDQNKKLSFIVMPHYLPLNICHGRCIGLYNPTDNGHSKLLNRYYSGLARDEREAIYNSMPCCAANETLPFTIVYENSMGGVVIETVEKAIKINCACN